MYKFSIQTKVKCLQEENRLQNEESNVNMQKIMKTRNMKSAHAADKAHVSNLTRLIWF